MPKAGSKGRTAIDGLRGERETSVPVIPPRFSPGLIMDLSLEPSTVEVAVDCKSSERWSLRTC
jgi:hypothetical protein